MNHSEFTESDTWGGRPVARKISETLPRERLVVSGVIHSTATTVHHGAPAFECTLDDGTGQIELLFLGRRNVAGLAAGTGCTVEGTATMMEGRPAVWNPLYRIEPADH